MTVITHVTALEAGQSSHVNLSLLHRVCKQIRQDEHPFLPMGHSRNNLFIFNQGITWGYPGEGGGRGVHTLLDPNMGT